MKITAEGLTEAVAALSGARDRARKLWAQTAYDVGAKGVEHLVKTYRSAPYPHTTATATARRSGTLARHYRHAVEETHQGVELTIGMIGVDKRILEYAGMQEYGGTIRAKNTKYLAIPLPAALTAAGVPKGKPRDFENTFAWFGGVIGRGEGLILQWSGRRGTKGKVTPLFLLKRSVTIPARPALAPTAAQVRPELERRAVEDLRRAVGA